MPGKMAKSAPRPAFGLPEGPVAVCTSRRSCRTPKKRENSHQFGSHLGNPGFRSFVPSKSVLDCIVCDDVARELTR
jgi:hypothetical protein